MSQLVEIHPEYVYVTVPAEYICVYHRILAMLADFGEEMLKDCKASCTDKNSGVIECFNMFNAAVAARKLGKDALASLLINYIKAKINQIYKGHDNSTSFVFPIDAQGRLKAFVSCGELPKFEINPEDGELYEHEYGDGFDEHFKLGPEDEPHDSITPHPTPPEPEVGLVIDFTPDYHKLQVAPETWVYQACCSLAIRYNGESIMPNQCAIDYYLDNEEVADFQEKFFTTSGNHNFKVSVTYNNEVAIGNEDLMLNVEE